MTNSLSRSRESRFFFTFFTSRTSNLHHPGSKSGERETGRGRGRGGACGLAPKPFSCASYEEVQLSVSRNMRVYTYIRFVKVGSEDGKVQLPYFSLTFRGQISW